jgi:hypothetical protein
VKRFDFGRADVDVIFAQLAVVDWCALFSDLGIHDCVEKFYIIIRECFDRFVPFYYSVDSENRQLWFDKELRNLENIRTKSHKYMKGFEKIYIRPMTELQQYEYDAALQRFRDLRGAFKGMHRLKYAQYIERIEAGLKSNPRCLFRFANLKLNSSGYPSAMFHDTSMTLARVTHRKMQISLASTFKVFIWGTIRRRISLWTTV